MNRTICLLIVSLIIINFLGCAHPTVVEPIQDGDYDMDCVELTLAIGEARNFKRKAQSKKGFTGGNVTRGILLWPTILGTYSNVNEAVHAADNRITHLDHIKQEKCEHQLGGIDEVLIWEKVKEKNTIGMYEVYLSEYPNGTFVETAQLELDKLNKQKQEIEDKEANDF